MVIAGHEVWLTNRKNKLGTITPNYTARHYIKVMRRTFFTLQSPILHVTWLPAKTCHLSLLGYVKWPQASSLSCGQKGIDIYMPGWN